MDLFWKERILAMAYVMSGGIRFSLAIDLTSLHLSPQDIYADIVETTTIMVGSEDILISQDRHKLVLSTREDSRILYI